MSVAKPSRLPTQGAAMADKSPRSHMSKKSAESIKEKRAEKHAKSDGKGHLDIGDIGKRR